MIDTEYRRNFTASYIATSLWVSLDADGFPLGSSFGAGDIAPKAQAVMRADCELFMDANAPLLEGVDPMRAGRCFCLTRNIHGAGFWTWPGEIGERLVAAATNYPEQELHVGDDWNLHLSCN